MRKLIYLISLAICLQMQPLTAQNAEFPNAIQAKLNLIDYNSLNGEDLKLGEGFEVGYFRNIAPFLNVGVPFKLGLVKLPSVDSTVTGNTVTTSLDLIFHLENMNAEAKVVPYAFGGVGYFLEDFGKGHAQFPFGAGINLRISRFAFVNVQAEYRKAVEDKRDNLQLGAGFVYLLHKAEPKVVTPPDSDKDGVPDALDKCPTAAGTAAAFGCPDADNDGVMDLADECPNEAGSAATAGCPDYDQDGLADKNDECPTEAGVLKGCPDTDDDGLADKDDKCPTEAGPLANKGCPEAKDSDGDGVADDMDECPSTAGVINGCPDNDSDGIADKDDKCPTEPGTKANNGCPAAKDTDGDGFTDDLDDCPTAAGTANGCPDNDADGIADKDDKCPNQPGTKANNGCPAVKDSDGDGFDDNNDPCPNAAGVFNGCPDTDGDGLADNLDKCPTTPGLTTNFGCPEIKKETKERLAFAMKAVQFETAKAVLKSESYAILDEIVGIMREYPDYKLSISGHTDNVGGDERNLRLSNDRAKACYDYLTFRGIKAERLRYAGFGKMRPLADNGSAEGREQNRRVEFELILD